MKSKRLTKAEKRVQIAKDVIEQILAKKYSAVSGDYVSSTSMVPLNKEVLNRDNPKCKVCACGSLILSAIRLFNRHTCPITTNGSHIKAMTLLKDWFSLAQLISIESAFEGWSNIAHGNGFHPDMVNKLADKAKAWRDSSGFGNYEMKFSDEHIIAIMKNIIDNNGTFKPEVL